jgi:hypothetical protein
MSSKRIKQYLVLLAVVGLIAVAANGSGTFASFSAQVTNANNTFATGTLFLHDTANGTTCTSETSSDNLSGTGCDILFNGVTLTPGVAQTVDLTLTNAGTIPASDITFDSSGCTDTTPAIASISNQINSGDTVTSISVSGLNQALVANTPITLVDGSNHQNFVVSANAASGASSISVSSLTASATFTTAGVVEVNTSSFTSSPALCSNLQLQVQEMTDNTFATPVATSCAFPSSGSTTCATAANWATFNTGTYRIDNGFVPLTLATGEGGNSGTKLSAGQSRYLQITAEVPGSTTNGAQNAQAKFNLNWHIDQ